MSILNYLTFVPVLELHQRIRMRYITQIFVHILYTVFSSLLHGVYDQEKSLCHKLYSINNTCCCLTSLAIINDQTTPSRSKKSAAYVMCNKNYVKVQINNEVLGKCSDIKTLHKIIESNVTYFAVCVFI